MKPIATALRRLANLIDPPTGIAHCIRQNYTGERLALFDEIVKKPGGIPVADRGDSLDFDWDEPHGEVPL